MRRLTIILTLLLIAAVIKGQTNLVNVVGKVSFTSSVNVYVKFKSTAGISAGDTLFIQSGEQMKPVLRVSNLSSTSCVCTALSDENLPVDHLVIAWTKPEPPKPGAKSAALVVAEVITEEPTLDSVVTVSGAKSKRKQDISGSLSLVSYSDLSNTEGGNSQRFRYTLSLDAENIGGSKLSAETYISFRHKAGEWAEVKENIFNALKIYSLAFRYDIAKTASVSVGRRINQRLANIGAMDGVQAEYLPGKFSLGAVAGFRPDFADYGFNSQLFQYGGYAAYDTRNGAKSTESSLAFMQQMNGGNTDRRFIYFQHSNSLIKNIYLLGSVEADLYKLENDQPKSTFDLTGFYFSMRYRLSSNFSISGSYDARKNVMYYETYKTFVDRIVENEMRQGFRLQASCRITKDILFGISSGYRFLKSDPHPSENVNGYLTYTRIPGINMTGTLSGTYLKSAFMTGVIGGANLSRDFADGKFQAGFGYRYVGYKLPESSLDINQNIAEVNLSVMLRKLLLSVNYEGTFEKSDMYNRIYLQARIRF
jgi:hypothetical protein